MTRQDTKDKVDQKLLTSFLRLIFDI